MTDARIPVSHVVGAPGEGWRVALSTLAHERRFGAMSRPKLNGSGRCVDEARAEAEDYFQVYSWYPQRAGRVAAVRRQRRRVHEAEEHHPVPARHDRGVVRLLERGGRSLITRGEVGREHLQALMAVAVRAGKVELQRIDGIPAVESKLQPLLREAGFASTHRGLAVYPRG